MSYIVIELHCNPWPESARNAFMCVDPNVCRTRVTLLDFILKLSPTDSELCILYVCMHAYICVCMYTYVLFMNMRCDRGVSADSKSSQMHTESGAIHTHTHTHATTHKYIYAYIMRNMQGQDRVALLYGVCVCVCVCVCIYIV